MLAVALGPGALCLRVCCLLALPGAGSGLRRSFLIPAGLGPSLQSSVLPLLQLSPNFFLLRFVHNLEDEASEV